MRWVASICVHKLCPAPVSTRRAARRSPAAGKNRPPGPAFFGVSPAGGGVLGGVITISFSRRLASPEGVTGATTTLSGTWETQGRHGLWGATVTTHNNNIVFNVVHELWMGITRPRHPHARGTRKVNTRVGRE